MINLFDTKFSSSTAKKGFTKVQPTTDCRIFKTAISPQRAYLIKKLARVNVIRSYIRDANIFFHEHGNNLGSREFAYAQTKCQSCSTSGRGARGSYRMIFPEISARF